MKKRSAFLYAILLFLLTLLPACGQKQAETAPQPVNVNIKSGMYLLWPRTVSRDFTPYFFLDLQNGTLNGGPGRVLSTGMSGTFTQEGDQIIVETTYKPTIRLTFEATAEETLRLTDMKGGYSEFWLRKDMLFRLQDPEADAADETQTPEQALAQAKEDGAVVMEDMVCTAGKEIWNSFYDSVQKKKNAAVLCAFYYAPEKPGAAEETAQNNESALFFHELHYDGKTFTVYTENQRTHTYEDKESYRFLLHMEGAAPAGARFSAYDYYVLTDDDSVTWEEIEAGLFSAQSDAAIRHCVVYQDVKF